MTVGNVNLGKIVDVWKTKKVGKSQFLVVRSKVIKCKKYNAVADCMAQMRRNSLQRS